MSEVRMRNAIIVGENALDQVQLLFQRERFAEDPEVRVLSPVVNQALRELREQLAMRSKRDTANG